MQFGFCALQTWALAISVPRVLILFSIAWFQHSYRRVDGARTLVRVGVVLMSLIRVFAVFDNDRWLSVASSVITVVWLAAAARWATVTFACAWRAANVMVKVPRHQRKWIRGTAWLSFCALAATYLVFSVLQFQADDSHSCERYYDARILIVLVATVLASLFVTLCHFLLQRMLAQLPVGPRGLKPRALRKMRAMHVLSICLVALTVASSVRSMRRGAPACSAEEFIFEEVILTLWSVTFLYHTDSMRDYNDKKFMDVLTLMFSTRLHTTKTPPYGSDSGSDSVKKAGGSGGLGGSGHTPLSTREKILAMSPVPSDVSALSPFASTDDDSPLSHQRSLSRHGSSKPLNPADHVKSDDSSQSSSGGKATARATTFPAATDGEFKIDTRELQQKNGKAKDNDSKGPESQPTNFSSSEPALRTPAEANASQPPTTAPSPSTRAAASAMSSSSPAITIDIPTAPTSFSPRRSTSAASSTKTKLAKRISDRKRDSSSRSQSRSRRLRFMKSLRNLRNNGVFKSSDIFEPAELSDDLEMDQKDALNMLLQAF